MTFKYELGARVRYRDPDGKTAAVTGRIRGRRCTQWDDRVTSSRVYFIRRDSAEEDHSDDPALDEVFEREVIELAEQELAP